MQEQSKLTKYLLVVVGRGCRVGTFVHTKSIYFTALEKNGSMNESNNMKAYPESRVHTNAVALLWDFLKKVWQY